MDRRAAIKKKLIIEDQIWNFGLDLLQQVKAISNIDKLILETNG